MVQVSPKMWAATAGESNPFPPKTAKLPYLLIEATALKRAPGAERDPAARLAVPETYCHVLVAMSNFQMLLERTCLPSRIDFPPNMYKPFWYTQEAAECTPPGDPCPPMMGKTAFWLLSVPLMYTRVHWLFLNCQRSLKTAERDCPP